MTRLERLRSQLRDLIARRDAERTELLDLSSRDDLSAEQESRWGELAPRFTEREGAPVWAEDEQIRSTETELRALEAVTAGFAAGWSEPGSSPTMTRQQPDPLADEQVQYGPVEQVRGAARTAIEKLSNADDSVRQSLTLSLERADDPTGKLSRHMIAASRDEYRSAFAKLISGRSWALTADEVRAVEHVRAASLTDAAGGYAVPTVLDPTLLLTGAHNGFMPNVIRQLANVRQITGDNLNVISTAGVTASFVAAQTEATDGAPTLSSLTITPHKAHVFVPFDVEIQGDWPSMESEMRRLMTVAKDDLEINKFTLGTGTNEPLGLFYDIYTNYTGQVQASAGANTFTAPDIYALAQKVAVRYRGRGSWIANEITYDLVRQFASSSIKDIFQESIALDRPGTILGRPAYGNPEVDATFGSGENYTMLFGDVREGYTIVDRVGMTVELVPHLFGAANNYPVGMRGLYAWWRTGARVTTSTAVAVLNIT